MSDITGTRTNQENPFVPELFLSGINTPVCVQLLINKEEFVLGKASDCDGILDFNDEISRKHCRILWKSGNYYVIDCASTNHTYLNGSQLSSDEPRLMVAGDRLQLSSSIFDVECIHTVRKKKI